MSGILILSGKSYGKNDINERFANVPTTIKAAVNGIILSGVGNDPDVARFVLDNCYACPELLSILEEELNVPASKTSWNNRKGLPGKDNNLTIPRGA